MSCAIVREALDHLGGQSAAAALLKRSQAQLSHYAAGNLKTPLDVAMRIEALTRGKYRARAIRPDLADLWGDWKCKRAA